MRPAIDLTGSAERRGSGRVPARLELTLLRVKGGPITGHTLDIGVGGMRVALCRPLGVDEVLRFRLALDGVGALVGGRARVLREYASHIYALRIEQLDTEASARLSGFLVSSSTAPPF